MSCVKWVCFGLFLETMNHCIVLEQFASHQFSCYDAQSCVASVQQNIVQLLKKTRRQYNTKAALRWKPDNSNGLLLCLYSDVPLPCGEAVEYQKLIRNRNKPLRKDRKQLAKEKRARKKWPRWGPVMPDPAKNTTTNCIAPTKITPCQPPQTQENQSETARHATPQTLQTQQWTTP